MPGDPGTLPQLYVTMVWGYQALIIVPRRLVLNWLGFWIHLWCEFFVKGRGNFSIRLQATSRDWDNANATLLQRRWYCRRFALALFQYLCFLDTNYIDTFWVYSCIYHVYIYSFVQFSCLCDACGVTSLFPCHFSSTLILFTITCIDNPTISFDINNYSVFIFTMVTIPFGSTRDLMMFAISSATIFYMISK